MLDGGLTNTPISNGLKCAFSLQEIEQSVKGNKKEIKIKRRLLVVSERASKLQGRV